MNSALSLFVACCRCPWSCLNKRVMQYCAANETYSNTVSFSINHVLYCFIEFCGTNDSGGVSIFSICGIKQLSTLSH